MANISMSLFNQLVGKEIIQELNLDKYSGAEKQALIDKVISRLQQVMIETALIKMSPEQYTAFENTINTNKDQQAIQNKIAEIAKNISGLDAAIKENLIKEIASLKNIIKK